MTAPLIWVLRDSRPGTAAQALGVAEALGLPFVEIPLVYDGFARLPNLLRGASLVGVDAATRARLNPPWPDLVIAAGRRAAPVARWIKAQSDNTESEKPVVLAQIMNPGRSGAADFDVIAVPHHDCEVPGGDAPNVLRITGAPHRVTAARLTAAAEAWRAALRDLPRPWIAVLVGGATRQRPFPVAAAEALAAQVDAVARARRGSVLLLTSRRTGLDAEAVLAAKISAPKSAFFWGQGGGQGGDNPYLGFLGLADAIVVTGDSVSMCCEACATGAPVFIYAPPGLVVPKHARLHRELYAAGYAKPFDAFLDAPFDRGRTECDHPPLNAAGDVAAALTRFLRPSPIV